MKGWTKKNSSSLYIQRAKALRKLGLSLADFRRLCILKGVFPRVPKKKLDGADKVYYHVKDIHFLAHEPLMRKFREDKVLVRKIRKARAKSDLTKAKDIESSMRPLELGHIIKERYPSFVHALDDLDDALSCIALFSVMPVDQESGIDGKIVFKCRQLLDEWMALIYKFGLLEKAFVSIKGYYYQITLAGKVITWLAPHEFSTSKAHDVDLKVLKTFLELYQSLLAFTLYKIYTMAGLVYPPKRKYTSPKADGRFLNLDLALDTEKSEAKKGSDAFAALLPSSASATKRQALFKNQVFYLSRETPIFQLAFALSACGAKVVGFDEILSVARPKKLSPIECDDTSITHHVVDKPLDIFNAWLDTLGKTARVFIQPQWIFDCINCNALLPTHPYSPGIQPPPHLSPFVKDDEHIPEQRKILDEWTGGSTASGGVSVASGDADGLTSQSLENYEEVLTVVKAHQSEIAAGGIKDATLNVQLAAIKEKKKQSKAELERERGKVMLPRKKRDIYKKVVLREKKEAAGVAALKAKAAQT